VDFFNALLIAIRLLTQFLTIAIFIRVILSWVAPMTANVFTEILFRFTEPVLAPLRRIIPTAGGLDLSPLAAIVLLQVITAITYAL
jgi:YggT family protein